MDFKDRIEELCLRAEKTNCLQHTMFLDGNEQAQADGICRRLGARYSFSGGWPEAERRVLFLLPDYLDKPDLEETIRAVRIEGSEGLTHRDYLGSVLAAGLRRECIGDILVNETGADLLVTYAAAGLLLTELSRVGRSEVHVEEIGLGELRLPERRRKTESGTVASLRLDTLGALAFSLQRSVMAGLIEKGCVSVNWKPCLKPGKELAAGDVLSVRGKGRAEVESIGGQSKKGRTYVTMSVWL